MTTPTTTGYQRALATGDGSSRTSRDPPPLGHGTGQTHPRATG